MSRIVTLVLVSSVIVAGQQAPPPGDSEAAVIEQAHTTIRFEDTGTGTRAGAAPW